jgi:hypothetical protein
VKDLRGSHGGMEHFRYFYFFSKLFSPSIHTYILCGGIDAIIFRMIIFFARMCGGNEAGSLEIATE